MSVAATSREATAPSSVVSVVFADDSRSIRTLAKFALSAESGCSVIAEAADGVEAVALYETHQPDCVVLDGEMPSMDGWAAMGKILAEFPSAKVVMLSGSSEEAVAERAVAAGAAAYLDKTTQLGELAATVRRVTTSEPSPMPRRLETAVATRPAATTDLAELRRLEYVVGHDLGEPLRIIEGFAGLLESRYAASLDDAGRLFLRQLTEASARMQSMLDDLLLYGRAGVMSPAPVLLDVTELVTAVRQALSSTIAERHAEVQVGHLEPAHADPAMLHTVLRAVITNALVFNRAAVPTVEVSGGRSGDTVTITISDNGIGIEPDHLERVFHLFQRLNSREDYPGTGTGLALCRRLMELQHGSVDLTSTRGAGTTVTLSLPA